MGTCIGDTEEEARERYREVAAALLSPACFAMARWC